jgi:hypothetical protein
MEEQVAQPKRTKVKRVHKDFASKNTLNSPDSNRATQESSGTGVLSQDRKRHIGQHTGLGDPPLMKK